MKSKVHEEKQRKKPIRLKIPKKFDEFFEMFDKQLSKALLP
jgi:hypothetical protein